MTAVDGPARRRPGSARRDDPPDATTQLRVEGPLDLAGTCRALRTVGGDPTWRIGDRRVVRATWTCDGPATVELVQQGDLVRHSTVQVRAWGPGAAAAVGTAGALVGLSDPIETFDPTPHPLVADLARRLPGRRRGATTGLWDLVVPTVLGQRVTGGEAARSWRTLVRRHGHRAPGPLGDAGVVLLAPTRRTILGLGDGDWHVAGVERRRADTVRRIARVLPALQRAAGGGAASLRSALETLPGVGPWTSTALAAPVTGDPDVVLLGDLHVPHDVCWALAGEPRGSDERMLELLEPFRGHRGRVVALIGSSGGRAPRRGPRYSPLPIARW
jgi:3-methyladenine DNA glycosylase/8-oxoguanine DNA glycosylase